MSAAIEIHLNGAVTSLSPPITLLALTQQLGLALEGVAVEHNGQIITRSRLGEVLISAGDTIEIVEFIGGG